MLPTTPPYLTAQGTILGTFQYMAPEQLEGQEADARTDIFAFGGVMYEVITGKKAFEAKSHASLIGAILHAEPAPLSSVQPGPGRSLADAARDLLDELKRVAEADEQAVAAIPPQVKMVPPAVKVQGTVAQILRGSDSDTSSARAA